MSWWIAKEPCYIPSLLIVLYTCAPYERDGFPSKAMVQLCTKRNILFLTSIFSTGLLRMETRLSKNSRDAIFYQPSFLTRVWGQQNVLTLKARSCTLGFLWFNRLFNARIASFGWTDFYRTDIHKFKTISSEPDGSSSNVALSTGGRIFNSCAGITT